MPRLIQIPILHSSVDMGSQGAAYKAAFIAQYGAQKWEERVRDYDAIWRAIEDALDALRLDMRQVKLYQDSLPVCGREADLVHTLAALGSRNHALLERLTSAGATLVGSESAELLLEEYRLLGAGGGEQAESLLDRRDRFIAARIAETLGPTQIGLLFIGALHDPGKYLPSDIISEPLVIHAPPTFFSSKEHPR
ncbi:MULTISPECIES: hypothetical protein [Methylosinus]|nr:MULTISPECIES: hypothetical protein [Methylosinus]